MNIDRRNRRMEEIFMGCLGLSKRKGQDYAGEDDSLANLRVFGIKGIIIRLFDKLYRLKSIEEAGKIAVKDESVEDTLRDVIIYAALAIIMKDEAMEASRVVPKTEFNIITRPCDTTSDEESPREYSKTFRHPINKCFDEHWDEKIGK